MQNTRRHLALILVVSVLVTSSFFAGYGAAFRSSAPPTTAAASLMAPPVPATVPAELEKEFSLFWEAWNVIDREFYDRKALDKKKRTYGAIAGAIEALGDPHTGFSTPVQSSVNEGDLRGSFDGIGVTVEMLDRMVVVVAPLPESPGEKAGLRSGDVILEANGEKLEGLSITEAVAKIHGPRGTEVRLTVFRQGERQPLYFTVTRQEIKVASVTLNMLDSDVAHIRLTSFTETTTRGLVDAVRTASDNGSKGIILDMRNNPGGLLETSIEVSSIFQKSGLLLSEEDKDGKRREFMARRMPIHTDLPLVVLVNRGSASASEIVAGAMKDTGRGKLVGQRTFGKGSVQTIHDLSDGSSIRVTIAHFFAPGGADINGVGISPDVEIEITEDERKAGRDTQLERAIEEMKAMTASR